MSVKRRGVSKGGAAVAGAVVVAVGVGVPLAAQADDERSKDRAAEAAAGRSEASSRPVEKAPQAVGDPVVVVVPPSAEVCAALLAQPNVVAESEGICGWWAQNVQAGQEQAAPAAPVTGRVPKAQPVAAQAAPVRQAPVKVAPQVVPVEQVVTETVVTEVPVEQVVTTTELVEVPVAGAADPSQTELVEVPVEQVVTTAELVESTVERVVVTDQVLVDEVGSAEGVVADVAVPSEAELAWYLDGYGDGSLDGYSLGVGDGYARGASDGYVQGAYDGYYLGSLDAYLDSTGSDAQVTLTVDGRPLDLVGVDPDNPPDLAALTLAGPEQPAIDEAVCLCGAVPVDVSDQDAVLSVASDFEGYVRGWMADQGIDDPAEAARSIVAAWQADQGVTNLTEAWKTDQGVTDVVAAWSADQGVPSGTFSVESDDVRTQVTAWAQAQINAWVEGQVNEWAQARGLAQAQPDQEPVCDPDSDAPGTRSGACMSSRSGFFGFLRDANEAFTGYDIGNLKDNLVGPLDPFGLFTDGGFKDSLFAEWITQTKDPQLEDFIASSVDPLDLGIGDAVKKVIKNDPVTKTIKKIFGF